MRRLHRIFRWLVGTRLPEPRREEWRELAEAERRLAVLRARLDLVKRK